MPPRVTSTGGVVNLVSVGDKNIMAQRLDPAFVKAEFESAGYTMLSEFVRAKTPLSVICLCGHKRKMRWADFRTGRKCVHCAGRVITQEHVKEAFGAEGYTLLSTYERSQKPLEVVCPKNHHIRISWNTFQQGRRCGDCFGKKPLSHDFVEKQFALEGYVLLEKYVNANKKIAFRCSQGHQHAMNWSNFYMGKRCIYCAKRAVTQEFAEKFFRDEGYTLISAYEKAKTNLDCICPRGHCTSIKWSDFRQGKRCDICVSRTTITPQFVENQLALAGYKLLETYTKSNVPMAVECNRGHQIKMNWNSFKSGTRCGICSGRRISHEQVEKAFKKEGYELLSQYKSSNAKIQFVCKNGHKHSISWGHFRDGKRCGKCAKNFLPDGAVQKVFAKNGWEIISFVDIKTPIVFKCDKNHVHSIAWKHAKAGVGCGICHRSGHYAIQYEKPLSKAVGRIRVSIVKEIERQGVINHWTDFYLLSDIEKIASGIANLYKNCKAGMHVDHILPKSWFNLLIKSELEACWNPKNLRYLPATDNLRRNRYPSTDEVEFMRTKFPKIFAAPSRNPFLQSKQLELTLCL